MYLPSSNNYISIPIRSFGNTQNVQIKCDIFDFKYLCFHGMNGCGKTQILKALEKELLKNNNVLFFGEDRRMNISSEEMDAIDVAMSLERKKTFRHYLETSLRIYDPFLHDFKKGDNISCGYLQLLNFLYSIYKYLEGKTSCVLIVDDISRSLHPLLAYIFITSLPELFPKINNIIFSTYNSYIVEKFSDIYMSTSKTGYSINVEKLRRDAYERESLKWEIWKSK